MIPDFFYDPQSKTRYERGRLLGKGGFAECYELTDSASKQIFAGKIVSKKLQLPQEHKVMNMITHEILIHLHLHHKHVVKCHNYCEDDNYYAIILELCKGGTLSELIKTKQYITEVEAHNFMNQLFRGVRYLHKNNIVHGDINPNNLFLTEEQVLKIGDFGLATEIDIDGKRKNKLCGTPNYMAPEILSGGEHGYEVDIWSMGCILYTLLVGHPPFETQSRENTYSKINKNEFHVPSSIGPLARALIIKMLQEDPSKRPTVDQCLEDVFMKGDRPLSALTEPPNSRLNKGVIAVRRPLGERNRDYAPISNEVQGVKGQVNSPPFPAVPSGQSPQQLLRDLQQLLLQLHNNSKTKGQIRMDLAEDRAATPMVWVVKWVDSKKHGFFGYCLTNNTTGLIFYDSSKLLLHADGMTIQHVGQDGNENFHTMDSYPEELETEMEIFRKFLDCLSKEGWIIGNGNFISGNKENCVRLPLLRKRLQTPQAIVMHLTNGTLQVNYQDDVKIILCPLMGAVSFIKPQNFRTFRLTSLAQYGCSNDLLQRLEYVSKKILPFLLRAE